MKTVNKIIKRMTMVVILLITATTIQAQLIGSDFGMYHPKKPVYDYHYKEPFIEPQKPALKLPSGFDKSFDAVKLQSLQDPDDGWLDLPYGNPDSALRMLPVDDGFWIMLSGLIIYLMTIAYRKW